MYNSVMPYTWNFGEQVHQLDPLTLVPKEPKSDEYVPLYQLLGMTEEQALEVSLPWRLRQVREERAKRLAATDWWVLPDRTPTPEQLAYRQALRDITENFTATTDVVWPTEPNQ